jgi:hypothetical protein
MAIIYSFKDKAQYWNILGASIKEPILDKSMNK